MKIKIIIAAYALLQLFFIDTIAQDSTIKFNLVEGNNGESLGQINAITQDVNGYMWFTGQTADRLYRYDGVKMTAYKPDNLHPDLEFGLSQETIYADSTGMIWIGFLWGGMEEFNPATGIFKDFKHDSSNDNTISAGMVSAILRDHLGRLWIGTANGLDRLDEKTGKFIHYRNDPQDSTSLSNNWVRSIYEDHEGVLWIGTGFEFDYAKNAEDGGLNRLEKNGKFKRFMHDAANSKSLINNKVRAIFEDSRGTFWVGTSGDGLHTMNRQTGTFERHTYNPGNPDGLSRPPQKHLGLPDPITFIKEDATGAIWIGTYISGINRYNPVTKKITHYESSNGYPDKNCWAAFNSRDGVLWLSSTDQGGFLYRVNPKINSIKNVSSNQNIISLYEDNDSNLWAAGWGSGLLQFDKNKNLVHQFNNDKADSVDLVQAYNINSIFQEEPDTLWLCTDTGIILFNKKTKRFSWLRYKENPDSSSKKFPKGIVRNIVKDRSGLIWISVSDKLMQYNPKTQLIKQYLHNAKDTTTIHADMITSVINSSSGDIWASSGNLAVLNGIAVADSNRQWGVNRLNPNTGGFVHYLNGVNALCMYNDAQGNIWVGSANKGLYYFDKKNNRFNNLFDAQSGTVKDPVVNIIEDEFKNLWIITPSSIVRLNADRKSYFIYGKNYGIRSNTLRFAGLCKTKNGEMLVGNNDGFYILSPAEMNEQSKPLSLIITNFLINNKPIFAGKGSLLTAPIEQTDKISLSYNQNSFSFNFAAIDYRAPEATEYYTLLENFDSVWRDAGGDKSANYINLPPGNYIFYVKAINIDGVRAEKGIQIIINKPWWKTNIAYAVYIVCFLIISFFANRIIRNRIIEKERMKTREKELAQAKEIEKAYHKLEQTHAELKSTQTQLIQSEKMASLGELTAGIAHEIQNPLNFVNNFSEVSNELVDEMKQELATGNQKLATEIADDIKANLEKINHHGKRADAIVKGMLQHSRQSSGKKEPTDINALCDEYLRLSYHGLRAKDKNFNADFKTNFDESIAKINIVPQDIGRVLLNLFNNAFYAVSEKQKTAAENYKPLVTIATKIIPPLEGKKEAVIMVTDNGNGIPSNIIDKIFQPFFTTKPTGQGTGLGLSLAYDIITKEHNGSIKVESKVDEGNPGNFGKNEGTTFIINLPTS